jgi:hypothetical protein
MAAELQWQAEDACMPPAAKERCDRSVARERPLPESGAPRDTPEAKAARARDSALILRRRFEPVARVVANRQLEQHVATAHRYAGAAAAAATAR